MSIYSINELPFMIKFEFLFRKGLNENKEK